MSRSIWCTRCGHEAVILAGEIPSTCPNDGCKGSVLWTTLQPQTSAAAHSPLLLTEDDKQMLRSLRIAVG